MSLFSQKNLAVKESIGEKLRQAREERLALSLESVSRQIKIEEKYLRFIEDNEWGLLPGEVYCRNFLKKYVDFLQLNWIDFNQLYNEQVVKKLNWLSRDEGIVDLSLKKRHLMVLPRTLRNLAIILVALIILVYIGQGAYKLTQAPMVDIIFPPDNFTTSQKSVKMYGWVSPESEVKINDQVVVVDGQGYFIENLDLMTGLNVIKIEGKKRQNKVRVVERKIMVETRE